MNFEPQRLRQLKGGETVKNMLRVLVIALTTMAFGGLSFAQMEKKAEKATEKAADKSMEKTKDKAMDKKEAKAEKPKTTRITGEVTAVDTKAGTLTVKGKDKDVNLTADSKAKDALGKVKVGDRVKVSYSDKDGKLIASSIAGVKGQEKKADKAMEKSKAMDKPEKKAEEKKAATK